MSSSNSTYSSAIADANNYTKWIIDELRPYMGKCVLEIGLGHGSYRAFLPEDSDYIGMDIDEASVKNAKATYPDDRFFQGDITSPDLTEHLKSAQIDTILCVNVLEHIDNDSAAIQNLLSVLPSGGNLLLFVPAYNALYNELDRLAGHYRRYRRSDMQGLMANEGAEIIVNQYFNPIGGLGWWINGFLHHKSLDDSAVNRQIALFDKYVLPISRLLNPLSGRWFGQSLVCVSRKL